MAYVIVGRYRGESEVVDHAETREDAEYLRREYQMAYGPEWTVTIRRARAQDVEENPRARTRSGRIRQLIHEGFPDGRGQAGAIAYRETREGKVRANSRKPRDKTLAEHAAEWLRERGEVVPRRGTPEWQAAYKRWVTWAFKDLKNPRKPLKLSGRMHRLPSSYDVDVYVWEERDRLHIEARDRTTDRTIAEWWDEDARQMFEDGFFERQPRLEHSVVRYLQDMGLVDPGPGGKR